MSKLGLTGLLIAGIGVLMGSKGMGSAPAGGGSVPAGGGSVPAPVIIPETGTGISLVFGQYWKKSGSFSVWLKNFDLTWLTVREARLGLELFCDTTGLIELAGDENNSWVPADPYRKDVFYGMFPPTKGTSVKLTGIVHYSTLQAYDKNFHLVSLVDRVREVTAGYWLQYRDPVIGDQDKYSYAKLAQME